MFILLIKAHNWIIFQSFNIGVNATSHDQYNIPGFLQVNMHRYCVRYPCYPWIILPIKFHFIITYNHQLPSLCVDLKIDNIFPNFFKRSSSDILYPYKNIYLGLTTFILTDDKIKLKLPSQHFWLYHPFHTHTTYYLHASSTVNVWLANRSKEEEGEKLKREIKIKAEKTQSIREKQHPKGLIDSIEVRTYSYFFSLA